MVAHRCLVYYYVILSQLNKGLGRSTLPFVQINCNELKNGLHFRYALALCCGQSASFGHYSFTNFCPQFFFALFVTVWPYCAVPAFSALSNLSLSEALKSRCAVCALALLTTTGSRALFFRSCAHTGGFQRYRQLLGIHRTAQKMERTKRLDESRPRTRYRLKQTFIPSGTETAAVRTCRAC